MTTITEFAKLAAEEFREHRPRLLRYFDVGDFELRYHGVLLLRREPDGSYLIRWPRDFYHSSPDNIERGILNALLRGVGLGRAYRFVVYNGRSPYRSARTGLFWVYSLNKWHRVTDFAYDTWYPLVPGELGRLAALHAHNHKTEQVELVQE